MTYRQALEYLDSLASFGIRLGLARIERLTELLGLPQTAYPTVHITGSNGKGSTAAMTAAALTASGLRTGLYTSPHLVSYTERMQVEGVPISDADFARTMAAVKQAAERMTAEAMESPTAFEVLTAQAFLWFAEQEVDYAVIEVGLGGLLDSTNVITPVVSAVTNVVLEHADRCDGTLEGVARHKAGIIKPGVPVVTAARGMPLDIIRREAAAKKAPLHVLGADFSVESRALSEGGRMLSFSAPEEGYSAWPCPLSLTGAYEAENAALALMMLTLLAKRDGRVSMEAARAALAAVRWPGRFELMRLGGRRVVVDGAHNPAGMAALRRSLDETFPSGPRVFLLGLLGDRDVDAMLSALLRPEDRVVVTAPASERAAAPEEIAARLGGRGEPERDYESALSKALALTPEDGVLCCTGSLYFIGPLMPILTAQKEL